MKFLNGYMVILLPYFRVLCNNWLLFEYELELNIFCNEERYDARSGATRSAGVHNDDDLDNGGCGEEDQHCCQRKG